MQSLYTTFGMSIYEQMGTILSDGVHQSCTHQHKLLGYVDEDTRLLINRICHQPIGTFSKAEEVDQIRASIQQGRNPIEYPDSTADLFVKRQDGAEIYIDITTVKPNKKEARALREKMLVWTALKLSQEQDSQILTYIGIPYNPYHPGAYSRSFVLDNCHRDEVRVQEELWSLLAGENIFDELMQIFEEVGKRNASRNSKFL